MEARGNERAQEMKEGDGVRVKSPASDADMDLVERFRKGDPSAFDRIFDLYAPGLLGFLTRMCGNPEDAREGLQDTFLAIFRNLSRFRGEASLKNWIFRIAANACLRKKRKTGESRLGTDFCSAEAAIADGGSGMSESPRWDRNPEALYEDREFQDLLARGVASMPPIYKVVLNLRDFEGFSTEETSRILGIKESTVKVRLHRARLLLKDWLEKRGVL